MNIIDFLLPQASQAGHLRDIAENMQASNARRIRARRGVGSESDLGSVALVCMALVASLVEKGVISEQDIQGHLLSIDALDGESDDALDVSVLRKAFGLSDAPPKPRLPRAKKLPPRKS